MLNKCSDPATLDIASFQSDIWKQIHIYFGSDGAVFAVIPPPSPPPQVVFKEAV